MTITDERTLRAQAEFSAVMSKEPPTEREPPRPQPQTFGVSNISRLM